MKLKVAGRFIYYGVREGEVPPSAVALTVTEYCHPERLPDECQAGSRRVYDSGYYTSTTLSMTLVLYRAVRAQEEFLRNKP